MLYKLIIILLQIITSVIFAQGTPALTGTFNEAEIRKNCAWKVPENLPAREKKYLPELKKIGAKTEVLIFMGSWCSDSKKWIPVFMRLNQELKFTSVKYIALDEGKKDQEGVSELFQITHIPTFIFLQEGLETGRITESPMSGILTQEILQIFRNQK